METELLLDDNEENELDSADTELLDELLNELDSLLLLLDELLSDEDELLELLEELLDEELLLSSVSDRPITNTDRSTSPPLAVSNKR